MENIRRFVSTKEAGELLDMDEKQVATLARRKELPAARIGRHWRIDAERLQEMFAPQKD
jgi:excisionase family DNA binding protein